MPGCTLEDSARLTSLALTRGVIVKKYVTNNVHEGTSKDKF